MAGLRKSAGNGGGTEIPFGKSAGPGKKAAPSGIRPDGSGTPAAQKD